MQGKSVDLGGRRIIKTKKKEMKIRGKMEISKEEIDKKRVIRTTTALQVHTTQ